MDWTHATEDLYAAVLCPICAIFPANLFLITRIVVGEECILKSSLWWSLLRYRYLVSLRPNNLPQHPILECPQTMFLSWCKRPSFTPIPNNRQNYNSVYLNLYIFWIVNCKTKCSALHDSKHSPTALHFLLNGILLGCCKSVAYPGILLRGGSTNSVEDRRQNGDLGAVAP